MASNTFPENPSRDTIYTINGRMWKWTGFDWDLVNGLSADLDNLNRIVSPTPRPDTYQDTVKKFRSDNGLPDPFSDMSFSGADIHATMIIPRIGQNGMIEDDGEVLELAELQTISYSIHRENSPVRTLGHVNPRGFVKGARTIAGSMVFTVFNEYAFYRINNYKKQLANSNGLYSPLADMLPPFDVVFSFFNEYGLAAKMKIFGITIVDEGQTMSIDDLITEQTYTYMARGIQPLVHLDPADDGSRYPQNLAKEKEERLQITKNAFGDSVVSNYKNFIDIINRLPQ
jgi:hypothetical protein